MQESNTNAWTLPAFIWIVLVTLGWSGCGPGRTMLLANGYECYIDNMFISISHPDDFGVSIHDASEFDLVDDIVFGTRSEWGTDQITGYFVLDTKSGKSELFNRPDQWEDRLSELELTSENIRWPGVFFHGVGWRLKLTGWLCVGIPVVCIGLWVKGLLKTRRDTFGLL